MGLHHGTSWDLAKGTGTVDGKPGHEYNMQYVNANMQYASIAVCHAMTKHTFTQYAGMQEVNIQP